MKYAVALSLILLASPALADPASDIMQWKATHKVDLAKWFDQNPGEQFYHRWVYTKTGRDVIIKFEGCYHGHADALLRLKGMVAIQGEDRPLLLQGIHHVLHPPILLDAWPDAVQSS